MIKKYKVSFLIVLVIGIIGGVVLLTREKSDDNIITFGSPHKTEGLTVVPTMLDEITENSAWVGTFQLIWNDLVNEIVKKDIVFNPQEPKATNLNKQGFTTNMLSDSYYYKKYGLKTIELKAEIEKSIKDKFNQESEILDLFDWSSDALNDPNDPNLDRYFLYVMLYRKFEYLNKFDKLEKGRFGEYDDIEYFGISDSSKNKTRKQIEVLYYNSEDDFAILINTKTNDEVIFYKNPKGKTFKEIYDNMNLEANKYKESKTFSDIDRFKAPNIKFNELREYDELVNKQFLTSDKKVAEIIKAVQTIQFYLDNKGGEIKSEAGMDVIVWSSSISDEPQPRNFYIDDTFAIFMREKGKDLPYFASKIDDITKFQ